MDSFNCQEHVEENPTFKDWEEFKAWEESLPLPEMEPLRFPEDDGYYYWEHE